MEAALDFDWQDIKWEPEGSEGNAVLFDLKQVEGWEVVDISRESGDGTARY
jgi:hypothetical protein